MTLTVYFELMKPRVMSLVVFTALVGLVAAPGNMPPVEALAALLCIAAGAGAAGALNMWFDADIDATMQRTAARPIPRGQMTPEAALLFGVTLSVLAVTALGLLINWVAAALLALTISYYIFVYTMWLKRRTPQNIVIGGAAGAFPPMIGWAAATGEVSLESVVLFLIIFIWTPPHFWALALYRVRDYERACIPMMPVVAGPDETRKQIWLYSLVLVPVAFLPVVLGFGGVIYGAISLFVGGYFLFLAWQVYRIRDGAAADRAAQRLFTFSLAYLFLLFCALLAEHGLGWLYPVAPLLTALTGGT